MKYPKVNKNDKHTRGVSVAGKSNQIGSGTTYYNQRSRSFCLQHGNPTTSLIYNAENLNLTTLFAMTKNHENLYKIEKKVHFTTNLFGHSQPTP